MKKTIYPRKWIPKNKNKYRGDPYNITVRSSWETRFLNWCDMNSSVIWYSSEELVIPYLCETDNKHHRYFTDAFVGIRDSNGKVNTYVIEIKPNKERYPPKYPGRQTPKYLRELETFIKNQSKWKAAKYYAEERGYKFLILDEYDLGIKKRKING